MSFCFGKKSTLNDKIFCIIIKTYTITETDVIIKGHLTMDSKLQTFTIDRLKYTAEIENIITNAEKLQTPVRIMCYKSGLFNKKWIIKNLQIGTIIKWIPVENNSKIFN